MQLHGGNKHCSSRIIIKEASSDRGKPPRGVPSGKKLQDNVDKYDLHAVG